MTFEHMTLSEAIAEQGPEVLDELSADTLQSYQKKANDQNAKTYTKRGPASKATKALRSKRETGLKRAVGSLNDINKKEWADHEVKSAKERVELHSHFHEHAPKILHDNGYTHHSSEGNSHVYTKVHSPSGVVSMMAIHKDPNKNRSSGDNTASHRLTDSTGWTNHDSHSHWGFASRKSGTEEVEKKKHEHLNSLKNSISRHEENLHNGWIRESEEEARGLLMTEGVEALTEAVIEKNALTVESLFNNIMVEKIADLLANETTPTISEDTNLADLIEEFGPEILDELSKDTLKRYSQKALGKLDRSSFLSGREMGARDMGASHSKHEDKLNKTADKRMNGLSMAINKLANATESTISEDTNLADLIEEFGPEILDELSYNKLRQYKDAGGKTEAGFRLATNKMRLANKAKDFQGPNGYTTSSGPNVAATNPPKKPKPYSGRTSMYD